MKIAIQFYGHLRTFRQTADNIIENFIKPLGDVDIFIHTWEQTDHSDKSWHNLDGEKRGIGLSESDFNFINEKFKPKKIVADKQFEDTYNGAGFSLKLTDIFYKRVTLDNIYYTRYKVNELRKEYQSETGTHYDFVINARLDLWFNKEFNLDNYLLINAIKGYSDKVYEIPDIDKKMFYCWEGNFAQNNINDFAYGSGSDVIYYGKPEIMDKVCNLYNHLDELDLNKYFYSCEYLLIHNAQKQNITPVSVNFIKDCDFMILREGQEPPRNKHTVSDNKALKLFINLIPIKKIRKDMRKKYL